MQLLKAVNFVHNNFIIHRDLKPSNIVVNAQHQLKVVDWGLARVFRADKKVKYENSVCTAWYRSPELVLGADRTTHGYGPAIDMWSVGCIFVELQRRVMGGRRLQRTLFDPRLDNPDGSGRLVLPPGFTTQDKADPTYLTSPYNLWKVITGKLGVPTPADWPGCDHLKLWSDFTRMGLTAVDGPAGPDGSRGASQDRATRLRQFEAALRIASMSPEAIDLAVKLLELDPRKRIAANEALVHPFFTGDLDSSGKLVEGGAVAKPSELPPLKGLDQAHSNKLKKESEQNARKLGGNGKVDDHWKDEGGFDMLGED